MSWRSSSARSGSSPVVNPVVGGPSAISRPYSSKVTPRSRSALPRDDRDARLVDVLVLDVQLGLVAPLPHLLLGLAEGVLRRVPVEVDVVHLAERHVRVVVGLGDVVV